MTRRWLGDGPRASRSRSWTVRRPAEIALNEGADFIVRPMAAMVMAAVGLVLLVACTNLANLMLARGTDRRHEFTVRRALGATRARLIREATAEGLLVVAAGGVMGVGVARALMVLLSNDLAVGNGTFLRVEPRAPPSWRSRLRQRSWPWWWRRCSRRCNPRAATCAPRWPPTPPTRRCRVGAPAAC